MSGTEIDIKRFHLIIEGFLFLPPLQERGDRLEGEETFNLIRTTCYAVMETLNEKTLYEEYFNTLKRETSRSFPSIIWDKDSKGDFHPSRSAEHVVHWGLFGAGMDIKNEKIEVTEKDSEQIVFKGFVYKNGINREQIDRALEKYRPYVTGGLAKYL